AANAGSASGLPQTQAGASTSGATAGGTQPAPTPDPLVEHERELTYNSRFASNFAFSPANREANLPSTGVQPNQPSALPAAVARPTAPTSAESPEKHPVNVNVNSAEGQPYVVFEGTELETALVNR